MDQNNPLAELTHKRRMSALGPGGLSVTVHPSRFETYTILTTAVCARSRTLKVPNIGLISYLATFAHQRLRLYRSTVPRYRKIKDEETGEVRCHVTDEVRYMTADVEGRNTSSARLPSRSTRTTTS